MALLYCVFPIADRRLWALGFGLPHRLPSKGCLQKLAPNEDLTSGSNVKITNNRQYQRSDLGPIKMPFECISLLDTITRESKKEFPCHSECWLRGFLRSPTIGLVVKMVKPTNEASTYRHWLRLSFSILRMSQCLTLNLHILGSFDLWLEREGGRDGVILGFLLWNFIKVPFQVIQLSCKSFNRQTLDAMDV